MDYAEFFLRATVSVNVEFKEGRRRRVYVDHDETETAPQTERILQCFLFWKQDRIRIHSDSLRISHHDTWAPVTMAWRVLRLRIDEDLQIWRPGANTLNKEPQTADKGWSSTLGLGEVLTTSNRKSLRCYETSHKASDLAGCCECYDEHSGSIKCGKFD